MDIDEQFSNQEQMQQERPLVGASPARVLVVDDHEVVRTGVCAFLAAEPDFVVVGEAAEGNSAITLALELQPDIILLDVFLGPGDGLDIAQQLLRACPAVHIVIFTGCFDDDVLFRAFRIGAHGYLQKALATKDILAALRAVQQGERVLRDAHTLTQVLDEFGRVTREQTRTNSGLTEKEIEIVRLVAEGCTNKEIALRHFWSEVTVKRKLQDIYRKLQVADRAQAVAEVLRMGLI
ncbi:response regulator [Dictyobacter kobayashii]|uniref:DNA-binding response regulator n=1 Tax=Dictyobacter kobayashii TaxID=2014872 RepID=A0A402AHL8_9CHLR|nr:response regulator transcription factor [Dictyobacter kobayashii]GCE18597.1 DNA-binding response regulator [Dictyobacter kobayashii]